MSEAPWPRWPEYYRATTGRPPRPLLLDALALFEEEGEEAAGDARQAVDLGCGAGSDTFELLRRGWRVLAVDGTEEAIARVQAGAPPGTRARLETRVAEFQDLSLPPADLIYASRSLPFCPPDAFDNVWRKILVALTLGGRFAGDFFGERDDWADRPGMTFHTATQARARLASLDVEQFVERDEDGTTALGIPKHWHLFSVIGANPVCEQSE